MLYQELVGYLPLIRTGGRGGLDLRCTETTEIFFSGNLVGVSLQLAGQGQQFRGEQKCVCLQLQAARDNLRSVQQSV